MDLFLQACGASGPLQLSLEWPGSDGGDCLSYDTPYVVIGRDHGSDLVLEHGEVSERHAYLQLVDGRLYCVDLGSRSGTALGGQSRRAGWVEPQQVVRIGPYRIRLVGDDAEGGGVAPPGSPGLPRLSLALSHRGIKASEIQISGGLALVGSSAECAVRLLDPGVSKIHCSLLHAELGLWVVDLLGNGGIQLNGIPVRHALIYEGDELQVGHSTIRIRHEDAVEPAFSRAPAGSSWGEEPSHEGAVHDVEPSLAAYDVHDEPEPIEEPGAVASWGPSDPDPAPSWEAPEPSHQPSKAHEVDEEDLAAISAKDRRASCRYPVVDVNAVMSWYEPNAISAVILSGPKNGPTLSPAEATIYSRVMARWPGSRNGTTTSRATLELARDPMPSIEETRKSCVSRGRLLDISQTGMLVLSPTVPPADQRVWLRLESPQPTDWVEVVVKGTSPEGHGAHRVRLAFRESCPYDFFKVALYRKPGS
jgi:pSer/pThr/pTyr-binding forkhead associated (FHA) protein